MLKVFYIQTLRAGTLPKSLTNINCGFLVYSESWLFSGFIIKGFSVTYGIYLYAPLAGVRVLPQVVQQELPADVPKPGHNMQISFRGFTRKDLAYFGKKNRKLFNNLKYD